MEDRSPSPRLYSPLQIAYRYESPGSPRMDRCPGIRLSLRKPARSSTFPASRVSRVHGRPDPLESQRVESEPHHRFERFRCVPATLEVGVEAVPDAPHITAFAVDRDADGPGDPPRLLRLNGKDAHRRVRVFPRGDDRIEIPLDRLGCRDVHVEVAVELLAQRVALNMRQVRPRRGAEPQSGRLEGSRTCSGRSVRAMPGALPG